MFWGHYEIHVPLVVQEATPAPATKPPSHPSRKEEGGGPDTCARVSDLPLHFCAILLVNIENSDLSIL